MFHFEKLETWQKPIAFAHAVYRLTQSFPADERFGLANQMRQTAVSISSNLAEGSSSNSRIDYARFVEIATGSLFEVISQAHLSRHQGFLADEDFTTLHTGAEELSRMLSGLRTCLLNNAGTA